MASHHEVWVLTRAKNRSAIEDELTEHLCRGLHFRCSDLPGRVRWWRRGQRGIQVYYYFWQLGAYVAARRLHREIGFDAAHHVKLVKYWAPSRISLPPIPFVWGPVGGGDSSPKCFVKDLGGRGRACERAREVARWFAEHDLLVRLTALRADVALATTNETAARMKRLGVPHVRVLSQLALSGRDVDRLTPFKISTTRQLRFVSIGRLLALKGVHLGLRAFARADVQGSEYWVIGDGPELGRLRALSGSLGISDRVRFWGQLSRDATLDRLGQCDVLVHPSLHDSGGMVCPEAMAAAKPVLCLDLGGPAALANEETGFTVPARNPEQAVYRLATAMRRLARDVHLRVRLAKTARLRVELSYLWADRARHVSAAYHEAATLSDPVASASEADSVGNG